MYYLFLNFIKIHLRIFSTTRSPKLSSSISPAPNRARIVWIQTAAAYPIQQNQRLLTLERRQSPPNNQFENLINRNEINN